MLAAASFLYRDWCEGSIPLGPIPDLLISSEEQIRIYHNIIAFPWTRVHRD